MSRSGINDPGLCSASNTAASAADAAREIDNPLDPALVVAHSLRTVGVAARAVSEAFDAPVLVVDGSDEVALGVCADAVARGCAVVVLGLGQAVAGRLGLHVHAQSLSGPRELQGDTGRLRSLFATESFAHVRAVSVVEDADSDAVCWAWIADGRGGWLLIGSQLARDLVRYRQGDPAAGAQRYSGSVWGEQAVMNERPNYLYWPLRDSEPRSRRHVDEWLFALRRALQDLARVSARPILPGGAPLAVVLTGDDDQAWLEKYQAQLDAIGDLPITYFLHPATRHDRATLSRLARERRIDFGLHPDALDCPDSYAEVYATQAAWYAGLVGEAPLSVRNHGFLNAGYWGHLPAWRESGCTFSLNLPGLDGEALTGTLLPFRVLQGGQLVEHWSMLTAFGDGMHFAQGRSDEEAAAVIHAYAADVRASGMPGVIVLNLHPQNIDECRAMHRAVQEVLEGGGVAWTVRECLRWFAEADGRALTVGELALPARRRDRFGSWWRSARSRWLDLKGA